MTFCKTFVFFSFFSFAYLLAQWVGKYQTFEACIFGCKHKISSMGSLAIEISSEKALELQLTCESCHKMTFSKFDSFTCAFQGTIFDNYNNKHFETFCLIMTYCLSGKWWGKLYIAHLWISYVVYAICVIKFELCDFYKSTLISSHLFASVYYNQRLLSLWC